MGQYQIIDRWINGNITTEALNELMSDIEHLNDIRSRYSLESKWAQYWTETTWAYWYWAEGIWLEQEKKQ